MIAEGSDALEDLRSSCWPEPRTVHTELQPRPRSVGPLPPSLSGQTIIVRSRESFRPFTSSRLLSYSRLSIPARLGSAMIVVLVVEGFEFHASL